MAADLGNLRIENFQRTTLSKSASNHDTTLELTSNPFPNVAPPLFYFVTLVDGDVSEIIRITDTLGTVLTCDTEVTKFFDASTTRVETWFTAEAWEVVQGYLTDFVEGGGGGGGSAAGDGITIEPVPGDLTKIQVKPEGATPADGFGIGTDHIRTGGVTSKNIELGAVTGDKIQSSPTQDGNRSIDTNHIKDMAVTDAKIDTVSGTKVTGQVAETVIPIVPFGKIQYTEQSITDGAPSAGDVGDLVIEFETPLPE